MSDRVGYKNHANLQRESMRILAGKIIEERRDYVNPSGRIYENIIQEDRGRLLYLHNDGQYQTPRRVIIKTTDPHLSITLHCAPEDTEVEAKIMQLCSIAETKGLPFSSYEAETLEFGNVKSFGANINFKNAAPLLELMQTPEAIQLIPEDAVQFIQDLIARKKQMDQSAIRK